MAHFTANLKASFLVWGAEILEQQLSKDLWIVENWINLELCTCPTKLQGKKLKGYNITCYS